MEGDPVVIRWLVGVGLAVVMSGSVVPPAAAAEGRLDLAGADGVEGSYLVVFKESVAASGGGGHVVDGLARATTAAYGGQVRRVYRSALRGFTASMSERVARRVAADPRVARVEQDRVVRAAGTQANPPSWGLDRIDQAGLPLDASYTYRNSGSLVHAYVIDTGIRTTHAAFGGRAVWGFDATGGGGNTDCNGHGTHVAGTIAGTPYGVAKDVRLVAVKVLDCAGSGTTASVVAGIDWVAANGIRPAVVSISLAGGVSTSLENAVNNLINSGRTVVVAAGNSGVNACTVSPARVVAAITVSATDRNDARPAFANFGTCVDLFAPGVNITSSGIGNDNVTNTISGTSMAAAHVAGAAAQWLSIRPNATPAEVATRLRGHAVPGRIANPGTGTPNALATVPALALPVLNQPGTAAAVVGEPFALAPRVSGGTPPYAWSATGLPPGLTIDPSTGRYSGTPTAAGRYPVRATITDAAGRSDSLTVTLATRLPGPVAHQAVTAPGFEAGPFPQPWSASSGVLGQTLQPARTGTASAWLGGTGFANRNTLSQNVAIPAGDTVHTLSFWLRVETAEWAIGSGPGDTPGLVTHKPADGPYPEPWLKPWPWPVCPCPCPCPPPEPWGPLPDPWDLLIVEIGPVAGPTPNPWTVLDVISNFDSVAGFQQRSYDVSSYAGTTPTLRLTAVEDTGATTSFVIDDITVDTF
jgi:subtilisin family serine protease